jgi:hypothetical protein
MTETVIRTGQKLLSVTTTICHSPVYPNVIRRFIRRIYTLDTPIESAYDNGNWAIQMSFAGLSGESIPWICRSSMSFGLTEGPTHDKGVVKSSKSKEEQDEGGGEVTNN